MVCVPTSSAQIHLMEQSEVNRMSQIQTRLSVLRTELESRRNSKYDLLMQRISELTQQIESAKATNEG